MMCLHVLCCATKSMWAVCAPSICFNKLSSKIHCIQAKQLSSAHIHLLIMRLNMLLYGILLHWQPHSRWKTNAKQTHQLEACMCGYMFYICLKESYLIISCRVRACECVSAQIYQNQSDSMGLVRVKPRLFNIGCHRLYSVGNGDYTHTYTTCNYI